MGMRINTNTAAMNAYRNLSVNDSAMSKSLEKLSSGLRINRAADDAAGLAISEGLKSQIGGLKVAVRNSQDGVSVVQTAEGALGTVQSMLQRLRDLAVQGANDSNSPEARANLQTEANSLVKEIDRISSATNFNGTKLLDGSASALNFQVGADGDANSQITISLGGANIKGVANALDNGSLATTGTSFGIADITALTTGAASFTTTVGGVATRVTTGVLSDTANGSAADFQSVDEYAAALRADSAFSANFSVSVKKDDNGAGIGIVVTANNGGAVAVTSPATGLAAGTAGAAVTGGIQFDDATKAQASIKLIDTQISQISTARAELGALQNRFEATIANLNVAVENLSASNSRIVDVDMASEMTEFSKNQILVQAGTSMLAQANQSSQSVLKLLQ